MSHHSHPFYGKPIIRGQEKAYIENLLKKYKHEAATEELKKKIWDELQMEKHLGNILIPFKVVLRKDLLRPYIEVILDTKV